MATAKKLPSGNWRVQVFAGLSAEGKRIYKSFTAETKKEAEFLAAQFAQTQKDIVRTDLTLREATERYIESKTNVLSPSTIRGYYTALRNYIPELFHLKIRDITAERVQIVFNDFAKSHSPKTCRNAHGLISAVLKVYRPELILSTTLPQKKKREIYVPDSEEIRYIYTLIIGNPLEIPFMLAAECGLRASEIAALRIRNIYPDHIDVKEALVPDKNNKPTLKGPKSLSGYRSIPISAEMSDYLHANACGEKVCPLSGANISTDWARFRQRHGINDNLVFHALRHHFASRCLLLGMPQKYIAELMGHSDTTMIEKVYQHVFPSAMEAYAKKLRKENGNLFSETHTATRNATQDFTNVDFKPINAVI